jgi:Tfp pilus assembly protein PilX
MKMQVKNNRQTRGGVLVTVLVFASIISLFLAGIARLAVAHYSYANTEADNAAAIQLADAGINYELRWISEDPRDDNRAHQLYPSNGQNGAYTGTVEGVQGSYTVSVRNLSGSGSWHAPSSVIIRSTGTVNGVSRTVEVQGDKHGVFDEYAIYATEIGTINDPTVGTINGNNAVINGNYGTNGPVTVNSSQGSAAVRGEMWFNGLDPTVNGSNVFSSGMPVIFPSVPSIADEVVSGGLTTLSVSNSNSQFKQFSRDRTTDPDYTIANAIAGSIGLNNTQLNKQALNSLTVDMNVNDKPGGTRYATSALGLYGNPVLILKPGNYYFTDIQLQPNDPAILIDNASGTVNIWVSGNNSNDTLDTTVIFTSTDKNKFRLYYNKCATLNINGTSTFYGSIYAVADGCDGTIKLAGNSVIAGSVIAKNVTVTGNSVVDFPNNGGGGGDGDWILWYGVKNNWVEVNPNGGVVFPDGTSN